MNARRITDPMRPRQQPHPLLRSPALLSPRSGQRAFDKAPPAGATQGSPWRSLAYGIGLRSRHKLQARTPRQPITVFMGCPVYNPSRVSRMPSLTPRAYARGELPLELDGKATAWAVSGLKIRRRRRQDPEVITYRTGRTTTSGASLVKPTVRGHQTPGSAGDVGRAVLELESRRSSSEARARP